MLSKFFVITVFITKCDKKTSPALFGHFSKKFVTKCDNKKILTNFTKSDKKLLQSEAGFITKCDKYYKLWQILQSET